MQDGFLTAMEPLLVKHLAERPDVPVPWKSEAAGIPLPPFSLGYVKGSLRCATLMALLLLLWEEGGPALQAFPKFMASLKGIYVRHIQHQTVQDEVFQNFKMSLRGSIRRPPKLLTWVLTLMSLKNHGYEDSAAVIGRFNSSVGSSFQLVKSKAVAVGNLLTHFPADVLMCMQGHVSRYGWDHCALSDENLSSKKILPVHTHRSPRKAWKRFAGMSVEATSLTFRRLFTDFDSNPHGRRKADKATLEMLAETAALLVNLAQVLMESFPVKKEDVEAQIYGAWVAGHMGLDMELHEMVSEKKESLAVTDVKFFRGVVEATQAKIPVPDAQQEQLQLSALEKDKYDLAVRQISYDRQAFRVYKAKVENFETHVHLAKVDWKQKRREDARSHLQAWLSSKMSVFSYDVKEPGALTTELHTLLGQVLRNAGLQASQTAVLTCHLYCTVAFGSSAR